MIVALSFLPVNDVVQGFKLLLGIIPDPSLNLIMHYFGENYIFGRQQQQMLNNGPIMRAPSRSPCPPATWNYRDVTLAGVSWMNNLCEGWNNSLPLSLELTILRYLN